MAIRIPIITDLQDEGLKRAKLAFGDFKKSVAEAQGGMNKFKAGTKSVFDSVKANAGTFAIAGAAAFAKFAADGIKAFQNLALEADKFSGATGLAVEDASRWMEVGSDIGIGVESIQIAIGKMNQEIGKNPNLFRDLGVDLIYSKDGALDVNATFLNTIQHLKNIKNPAQRAAEGVKLLGRGWKEMSQFINIGSEQLSKNLKSVSNEQVIDPKEVAKAKELRDTMKDLGDQVERVKLALGEALGPVVRVFAKGLDIVLGAKDIWDGFINGAADALNEVGSTLKEGVQDVWHAFFGGGGPDPIPVYAENMRLAKEDTKNFLEITKKARVDALDPLRNAIDKTTTALENADTAWKTLTNSLDREVALDNATAKLAEVEAAAAKAFGSGAQADIDAYQKLQAEYIAILAGISGGIDNISSKEILFKFRTEGDAAALEYARYLARGAEYGGITQEQALNLAGIPSVSIPHRASGGPVMAGKSYLVGERGPELFTPNSSGGITSNSALSSGTTINVTVNGGDPNSIVRALQQYVRQSGPVPVNTRAM